jgi:uncharacterized protein YjbI with pentapeptide repeats
MNFQIKHRFDSSILFEFECGSLKVCIEKAISAGAYLRGAYLEGADLRGAYLEGADLEGADLRGAYLRGADLEGADLEGADLEGADLRGAYLRGADLRGADLEGADLEGADLRGAYLRGADLRGAYLRGADGEKIKIKKTPLQILGLHWDIIIFDAHMKIGCEFHAISDWKKYDADKISKMDPRAVEWWSANKESILTFCDANERA